MKATLVWLKKWSLLIILALALFLFVYFKLYHFLSLASLGLYHLTLQHWAQQHLISAVAIYVLVFTGLIACGIPGATILGLLGGFIFGQIALLYAMFATTAGGSLLYFAVKYSFAEKIAKRSSRWLTKFEAGFRHHAFRYLLMLRLIPVLPCWVSNIAAGIFNVRFITFVTATLIGIFPSTYLYVLTGRSLDLILANKHFSTTELLLKPAIILPLIGLMLITLLPIIYKIAFPVRK